MRNWRGAVGLVSEVWAKDREKKLKEEERKEEERLQRKRKEEKLKEDQEKLKEMGFPEDRIRLALRDSQGDFDAALHKLLS